MDNWIKIHGEPYTLLQLFGNDFKLMDIQLDKDGEETIDIDGLFQTAIESAVERALKEYKESLQIEIERKRVPKVVIVVKKPDVISKNGVHNDTFKDEIDKMDLLDEQKTLLYDLLEGRFINVKSMSEVLDIGKDEARKIIMLGMRHGILTQYYNYSYKVIKSIGGQ